MSRMAGWQIGVRATTKARYGLATSVATVPADSAQCGGRLKFAMV